MMHFGNWCKKFHLQEFGSTPAVNILQSRVDKLTMLIQMNDGAHVIWANLFLSGQHQFTPPDGQVEIIS